VNPLLDKIEVQDVLVRCGLNPGKAGRILKSMSEERKEQHAKNGTTSTSTTTASTSNQSKRAVQQSGSSTGIPKALYKENEMIFAKMCKEFGQSDRMFIQQCLVNSKWNEEEAVALIEAGPPIGINSVQKSQNHSLVTSSLYTY
jgi:hypothetical protein